MTVLLSRSLRWAGLVQMAALGVSVLAVYGIASRIGFDRRGAAFGALVFATLPVVAMQAPPRSNDVVVAALVATTVFFVLGRSRGRSGTGMRERSCPRRDQGHRLHRGPRDRRDRRPRPSGTTARRPPGGRHGGCRRRGGVVRRQPRPGHGGAGHDRRVGRCPGWARRIVARASRYAVETVELPGPSVGTSDLYLVGAAVIALVVWLLRGRWSTAVVAGCLAALPVLTLRAEHGLHRVYWNGWELVGFDEATLYGTIRDPTIASNLQSWYGPLGVSLCVAASIGRDAPRVPRKPPVGGGDSQRRAGRPPRSAWPSRPDTTPSAVATSWGAWRSPPRPGASCARCPPSRGPWWRSLRRRLVLTLADFTESPRASGCSRPARDASSGRSRAHGPRTSSRSSPRDVVRGRHASPGTTIAVTRDQVAYRPSTSAGPASTIGSSTRTPSPRRRRAARAGPCSRTPRHARAAGGSRSSPRHGLYGAATPMSSARPGRVPRMPHTLSILMPVYNELATGRGGDRRRPRRGAPGRLAPARDRRRRIDRRDP